MCNRLNRRSGVRGTGHCLSLEHGFTLIELMVVVAIIGIILTTAVSMGINMRKARALSRAADELVYQLQRAKLTAIKEFTPTSIIIDKSHNRYKIDRVGAETDTQTAAVEFFSLGNKSSGVVFDDSENSDKCVTFTPSGVASKPGKIYLTNEEGVLEYRIRVSGAGGISKHVKGKKENRWYQPGEHGGHGK